MHSHVIRTTTQRLEATLDDALRDAEPQDVQAYPTGGRDWVVVLRHKHNGDRSAHRTAVTASDPPVVDVEQMGTDPARWAESLARVIDGGADLDEGLLIAWFANAMGAVRSEVDTAAERAPIRVSTYDNATGKWAGWVEDQDRTWIIYLRRDSAGRLVPEVYFPARDPNGRGLQPSLDMVVVMAPDPWQDAVPDTWAAIRATDWVQLLPGPGRYTVIREVAAIAPHPAIPEAAVHVVLTDAPGGPQETLLRYAHEPVLRLPRRGEP